MDTLPTISKMKPNRLHPLILVTIILTVVTSVNYSSGAETSTVLQPTQHTIHHESIVISDGDIRCHCNQPACVRTGYMCKSTGPQAACFVEHSGFVNVDRSSDISRHGCIEMLPIEERTPCLEQALDTFASQNGGYVRTDAHAHRHALSSGHRHGHKAAQNHKRITCCLDIDMCNWIKMILKDDETAGQVEQKLRPIPESPWISLKPRGSSSKSNEDIDSLGKHLQESYGVKDSHNNNGSFWFEMFTFSVIMVLLVVLVLLILFGVRFIRQDDCQLQKTQTHLSTCSAPKRSMLDWKCFMSPKRTNPQGQSDRPFSKSLLYGSDNAKQGLYHQKKQSMLLSVQVGLESQGPQSQEHLTKVDNDLSLVSNPRATSNLPNIIYEHTLPGETTTTADKQAPIMNGCKLSREPQNSIYLSLLPPSQYSSNPPKTNFDFGP